MPTYFSGANARIHASVGFTFAGLKQVKMTIGGLIVWDESYPGPGGSPPAMQLADAQMVMFDSSKFASGTNLQVKVDVWDWMGGYRTYSNSAIVKNKVLTAKYPDAAIGDADDIVVNSLSLGYDSQSLTGAWTPQTFVDSLNGPNVVYYAGHGNVDLIQAGHFWTDPSDPDIQFPTNIRPFGNDTYVVGHPTWVNGVGVEPNRTLQMGTGYPPFNSTSVPPVNLAVAVACLSGVTNNFIRFAIPYYSVYGTWCENQAFTGFGLWIPLNREDEYTQILFDELEDGQTIEKARQKLADNALFQVSLCEFPPQWRDGEEDDMPIWGDQKTRLKSVYTGTSVQPIGWFRLI